MAGASGGHRQPARGFLGSRGGNAWPGACLERSRAGPRRYPASRPERESAPISFGFSPPPSPARPDLRSDRRRAEHLAAPCPPPCWAERLPSAATSPRPSRPRGRQRGAGNFRGRTSATVVASAGDNTSSPYRTRCLGALVLALMDWSPYARRRISLDGCRAVLAVGARQFWTALLTKSEQSVAAGSEL